MSSRPVATHADPLDERISVRLPNAWALRLAAQYPSRSAGIRTTLNAGLPDPTPHLDAGRACLAGRQTVRPTVRIGLRDQAAIERAADQPGFENASHVIRAAVWEVLANEWGPIAAGHRR